MRRACEACGRQFEAKSQRARFCSSTCRGRASRGATVARLDPERASRAQVEPLTVADATAATLTSADRLDTPAGTAAMVIARKLDKGGDTGSAIAALVRELRAAVTEATAGAGVVDDPLDEIALKRKERQSRAAGA